MRKKIKLHIKDLRESFGGNIKRPYYLFIEIGEERFAFSNKKKANKWLTTFENNVNDIAQELIKYIPKLQTYNTELSLFMDYPEQERLREDLNYCMKRYWMLYHGNEVTAIGREINNIFSVCQSQMEIYKKVLQKNARNQLFLKNIKVDIKHLKYLRNDIDAIFDTTKTLKTFQPKKQEVTSNLSEKYLSIA